MMLRKRYVFFNWIKLNWVCLKLVKLAEPAQQSAAPLQHHLLCA